MVAIHPALPGPTENAARRTACAICGSHELHIDAVERSGWLLLAECAHCDHRWTQALANPPPAARGPHRVRARAAEAATAA
jgi:hypothetical protein